MCSYSSESPKNVIIVTADMKNDKSLYDCCLFFMNCHISLYLLNKILHHVKCNNIFGHSDTEKKTLYIFV